MSKNKNYQIVYGMGKDLESYFLEKGYRNDVSVLIQNESYEMYFFLSSTLEYELTIDGYCTFPGLVILENITTNNIEVAIQKLFETGYFNYLNPIKDGEKRFWDKTRYTPL